MDRATSTLGETDACHFCTVVLALPAAVACANVGDLTEARGFLDAATRSVAMWGESSWQGALLEAEAAVALAEDDRSRYHQLMVDAATAYASVGHGREAARCLAAAEEGPGHDREGSKKVNGSPSPA